MPLATLPIDSLLVQAVEILRQDRRLVIEAPPGAGKTTRVPPALLDSAGKGEIVVLQPRRLPARMAASRVAQELAEPLGQRVGYTVRYEDVTSSATRIRFMTEGLLLRRLLVDPTLAAVSTVILDEFHERHLASDLALALLRNLQLGPRPDLNLVVMSATLDADPVRAFLGDCQGLKSTGRLHPVTVEYQEGLREEGLSDRVARAVRSYGEGGLTGVLLVFVPGAGEIRRVLETLSPWADKKGIRLAPLHGDLSPVEQQRAVEPSRQPRVVVSTNVAESSVTIEGVVGVIDTGLARIASYSPWSGLPRLVLGRISKASATQRAGRAGRLGPGHVVRLYSRQDFDSMRDHDVPEIARTDLAEAILTLAALGVRKVHDFPWFEPPPHAALEAASSLLGRLSALDSQGQLTEIGRQMLRFPTHPRLARLMVEGKRHKVFAASATVAALLSEGDIEDARRVQFHGTRSPLDPPLGGDLLERFDRFEKARQARFAPAALRGLSVDVRAAEAVDRARRQYLGGESSRGGGDESDPQKMDQALALSVLCAFPDRLMRRRLETGSEAVLSSGSAVTVGTLPPERYLVAVDAEEKTGKGGRRMMVRMAVGVEPEWILDAIPQEVTEWEGLEWNESAGRVDRKSTLGVGAVLLDESTRPAPPGLKASQILAEKAVKSDYINAEETLGSLNIIKAKLDIIGTLDPSEPIPRLTDETLQSLVRDACAGLTSLAELSALSLTERLMASLSPKIAHLIRTETPDHLTLPGGRRVPIHYQPGTPPYVASRLQDFFGMRSTPTLCRGRVPLTVHLLAPNQRAVQVTSDLAGFWTRHYPAIRRELCRRYPRHPWPEDGATATPPEPKHRR